ncbi:MAG: hypothetical protein ACM3U2_14045 [Deltaproteobacteria bacterium]
MHAILKLASVFLLLLLAGGCQQAEESGPPNMMPNILGALQIRDAKERDAALATACRESADQGSGPTVLMGIPRIEDSGLRDEVAEECAITLGDVGQMEAAVEVARLISDQPKRDELLAKLGAE